jgi:hypothetical protein
MTSADRVIRAIRSWRVYHFHDTSPSARLKQTAESTFRRLKDDDLETWLDDYGLGDLREKNVIGGRP